MHLTQIIYFYFLERFLFKVNMNILLIKTWIVKAMKICVCMAAFVEYNGGLPHSSR